MPMIFIRPPLLESAKGRFCSVVDSSIDFRNPFGYCVCWKMEGLYGS